MALVNTTLAGLRTEDKPRPPQAQDSVNAIRFLENASLAAPPLPSALPEGARDLVKGMSSDKKDGLGSQVEGLQQMATAIEPIITSFDSVLVSRVSSR